MLYENDKYEIPEEVLEMSHEQIQMELEKARQEMLENPKKKPKKVSKSGIKFNFD